MQQTCKDCINYRQHYIKQGKTYHKIFAGHCVYPRIKNCKAAAPACEYFEAAKP